MKGKKRKKKVKHEAEKLMKKGYSSRDAYGVATHIVTGKGPKKKRKKRR